MSPIQPTTSLLVLVCRIFWMMLGPLLLALLAFTIIMKGNGWFTPADFAFLAVLGVLFLARWLEFREGNPLTSSGEPATPGQSSAVCACCNASRNCCVGCCEPDCQPLADALT